MKFLIVYGSINGNTERMAGYIAEGVRIAGHEVDVKRFPDVREPEDFAGYDGYVFGGPTYHKDLLHGMKAWLFRAKEGGLDGKVGGAFGSHTHSGEAPGIVYDTMRHVFKMNMVDLGPFKMEESVIGPPTASKPASSSARRSWSARPRRFEPTDDRARRARAMRARTACQAPGFSSRIARWRAAKSAGS